MNRPHLPVLLDEVLENLAPVRGGRYIDGTVGAGGHAAAILRASGPDGMLLGLDGDPEALEIARAILDEFNGRALLVRSNFKQLRAVAAVHDFIPAQGVLLDLGLSSIQLANPARGFAFTSESLDMRMDSTTDLTAAELVNELDERELADLIYRYGEEHLSRRIAKSIVAARPIESAQQLAQVIQDAVGRHGRIHPATRTFQGLRLAVNHELENLQLVLPQLAQVLAPGGIAAVITFHSLEDRIVKQFFKASPDWENLTKHTIKPRREEILRNPRSRSAQLRVARRNA
ncbi:MAG: 16S rRNA (cytosine(1402)-N(4))-methyltransferase RsmH [Anaerolineae bacterium]